MNNSGFFVTPLTQTTGLGAGAGMWYNSTSAEICYDSTKNFIIDHPLDSDKYLVHACLEGPEAGVYYRGKGEIVNGVSAVIVLPDYVDAFAYNFTVHVTSIYNLAKPFPPNYQVSEVENGRFTVYGPNGKFYWVVYGERQPIQVEPLKSSVDVKGSGPYKWI